MTRGEAIKIIKGLVGTLEFSASQEDALIMAIEALQHDVIFEQIKWERDVALQTLEEHGIGLGQKADRPTGEWIFNPKDAIDLMFTLPKCSKCEFESADGGNFCPNCGARMKGGAE